MQKKHIKLLELANLDFAARVTAANRVCSASLDLNNPAISSCTIAFFFQLYGMHAEFYKLRSLCVDIRSGKYSYSVCPFGMVKQTDAGHSSIVIGRSPEWLDRGPDVYRLSLNDGDSTNCPGLQPRKTVVSLTTARYFFMVAVVNMLPVGFFGFLLCI
jgi:hypothetical protein